MCLERTDSLEKTLMLGKIEGGRRKGWQRMRWLDGITTQWTWVWVSSGSWWWTGKPGVLHSMGLQRFRPDWETDLNWTECLSYIRVFNFNNSNFFFLSCIMLLWLNLKFINKAKFRQIYFQKLYSLAFYIHIYDSFLNLLLRSAYFHTFANVHSIFPT